MGQNKGVRIWIAWGALVMFTVTLLMATSGCETLRKKFTRAKKKDATDSSAVEPVLDPVEYPDKQYTAQDRYKEHYMLYKVWSRELAESLDDRSSDKKQRYNTDAMLSQMQEMQKLLTGEKQTTLGGLCKKLESVRMELDKPEALRPYSIIVNDVRQIDKKIRDQFKPDHLEGSFATAVP